MSSVHEAVAAITAEIGAVSKDATSGSGNWSYKYRGIEAVMNALHPLLAKHGVTIVPRIVHSEAEWVHSTTRQGNELVERLTTVRYEFDVYGSDGSMFTGALEADGISQRDKSAVIASSYAYRQFVCLLFCIPTEDMADPEEDNRPVKRQPMLSESQQAELTSLFGDLPAGEPRASAKQAFMAAWGRPDGIPEEEWDSAYAAASKLVAARLAALEAQPPDEPLPEPNGGDTVARRYLRAEVEAYAPMGMTPDQYIEALLVKANEMQPQANKGMGFEKWQHLQKHPALITELIRQTQAGTLDDPHTEPFE